MLRYLKHYKLSQFTALFKKIRYNLQRFNKRILWQILKIHLNTKHKLTKMSNNYNSESDAEDSDDPMIPKGHHGLIEDGSSQGSVSRGRGRPRV